MVTNAKILQLSRRIAEQFDPEQIILFGSRARGRPRRDSDVDLLVVMRFRGLSARKAAEILNRMRLARKDPFFGDIVRRGKVLYEAAHA